MTLFYSSDIFGSNPSAELVKQLYTINSPLFKNIINSIKDFKQIIKLTFSNFAILTLPLWQHSFLMR